MKIRSHGEVRTLPDGVSRDDVAELWYAIALARIRNDDDSAGMTQALRNANTLRIANVTENLMVELRIAENRRSLGGG